MNFRSAIPLAILAAFGLLAFSTPAWAYDDDFDPANAAEGLERIIEYAQSPTDADGAEIPLGERLDTLKRWGDKVWEMDPTVEQKMQLIQLKVEVLSIEQRLGKRESGEQLDRFLEKIAKSDEPELAEAARAAMLNLQISRIARLGPGERIEAMRDITNKIVAEKPTSNYAAIAASLATSISYELPPKEAAPIVEKLATHFASSDDELIQQQAEVLKGMARRLNLPGNPIELTGTKLGGEDLDWKSYKGKVVLVDFWATWCGPCLAEFPHLKELYEKYNPHGFEIVGINLDDEKQTVEAFQEQEELPWTIVWTEKQNEGGGFADPNAQRYGIMALPTMMLVDRDGNVESVSARGLELDQLLAEAFPKVDVSAEDPDED